MTVGPHPVDIVVGRNLREIRLRRGLSQSTLAETVGITFQQIQKYEKGTNRVSASMMHDLAHALNVEIPAFFKDGETAADEAQLRKSAIDLTNNRLDLRIMERVSEIKDAKIKRRLLALLDALLTTPLDEGGWSADQDIVDAPQRTRGVARYAEAPARNR